jgi:pyruvate dehydrogenase (quinone)
VELAMPPTITAARAKGFTLYVLKAILNGQGSEMVESAMTNILR